MLYLTASKFEYALASASTSCSVSVIRLTSVNTLILLDVQLYIEQTTAAKSSYMVYTYPHAAAELHNCMSLSYM